MCQTVFGGPTGNMREHKCFVKAQYGQWVQSPAHSPFANERTHRWLQMRGSQWQKPAIEAEKMKIKAEIEAQGSDDPEKKRAFIHSRMRDLSTSEDPKDILLWLVDPVIKTLEVYRHEQGGWKLLRNFGESDMVCAEPFDVIEIDLATLWWD